MIARVCQLRVKLKSIKKGNSSIIEVVRCVKAIVNLLLALGDMASKQDQIEFILVGLLEDYNPFVMQMYGERKPQSLYDVKARLYIKKLILISFFRNWMFCRSKRM